MRPSLANQGILQALAKFSIFLVALSFILYNQTRNIFLARLTIAENWLSRLVGLLGKKQLAVGEGLYIPHCRLVHTFFMRFPIDVLFLNKELQVVAIVPALFPFRVSPFVPAAQAVVELTAGRCLATATRVGDCLLKEENNASRGAE